MPTAFELEDLNARLIRQARRENIESVCLSDLLEVDRRHLTASEVLIIILTLRFARFLCAFDIALRVCLEHTKDRFVEKYQSVIREHWPDGPYCQVFIDPMRTDLSLARELLFSDPVSGYLALDRAFAALDQGSQGVARENLASRMDEHLRQIGEELGFSKAENESIPESRETVSPTTTERN